MNQATGGDVGVGMVGVRGTSTPTTKGTILPTPAPTMQFDLTTYSRLVQHMSKIYSPYDPATMAAAAAISSQLPLAALTAPHILPSGTLNGTTTDNMIKATSVPVTSCSPLALTTLNVPVINSNNSHSNNNNNNNNNIENIPVQNTEIDLSVKTSNLKIKNEVKTEPRAEEEHALDLSTQGLRSLYSSYKRIKLDQVKPKVVEDIWVENDIRLSWTDSRVAAYNPAQKLFMCVDCECVGFLSRVAEHWLGAHANLRVFHCPRCPYTSAWSRCVKMHLTRQHNEQFADTTMWKENATLLEVTKLMQELRTKVETKIDANSTLADKRFYCPHCPYATDRRDLYTRHENIHKDNKPFHCYLCF